MNNISYYARLTIENKQHLEMRKATEGKNMNMILNELIAKDREKFEKKKSKVVKKK